jgi:hypothetical protein
MDDVWDDAVDERSAERRLEALEVERIKDSVGKVTFTQ